ncbi:MAG: response regulator transcription factor [Chloroflexi bacterium]|nr:MAG: response regulator transcription factor [Chloroflexota bacterium]
MGMNGGASAMSGILVVDELGTVFSLMRSLDLGVPLWRVTRRSDVEHLDIGIAVLASYEPPDWTMVSKLSEQFTTVIVATRPNHDDACHAVSCGAFGYIEAQLRPEALRRSILGALNGEHAYSRRVLAALIRNGRWLRSADALPLTPRQRQVISLIARGAADKEIAESLGITTATAQKHVTNLLRRLKVPNRAAAVAVMAATSPL